MMINALCVDEVMVAAEVAAENWNDYEIGIKRIWKYGKQTVRGLREVAG